MLTADIKKQLSEMDAAPILAHLDDRLSQEIEAKCGVSVIFLSAGVFASGVSK